MQYSFSPSGKTVHNFRHLAHSINICQKRSYNSYFQLNLCFEFEIITTYYNNLPSFFHTSGNFFSVRARIFACACVCACMPGPIFWLWACIFMHLYLMSVWCWCACACVRVWVSAGAGARVCACMCVCVCRSGFVSELEYNTVELSRPRKWQLFLDGSVHSFSFLYSDWLNFLEEKCRRSGWYSWVERVEIRSFNRIGCSKM